MKNHNVRCVSRAHPSAPRKRLAYDRVPILVEFTFPMPQLVRRQGALAALVLLTAVWSYNWIVMKQVLQHAGPFHFAALRGSLATAVLFLVLLLRGESLRPPPLGITLGAGLSQTTGFQALVQWALVNGGAGKTALLAFTMPFWVVLLAWIALRERPGPWQWASIATAAVGLVFVLEPWHGLGAGLSPLLAVLAGLCWGIGVILSKHLFARYDISPLQLTAWQMLLGSATLVAIAVAVPERPTDWTPFFIGALAYNAILASGLAWVLWSVVVQRLPATVAGMTSLAIPLTSVLLAWAMLGERPSPVESLGIGLIALALVGVTQPAGRSER